VQPPVPTAANKLTFLLGTGLLLALPALMGARSDSEYLLAIPRNWAPAEHVYLETAKSRDIDVLFLGSSLLEADIDAGQVKTALSKQLGRPAEVEALLTWGYSLLVPYEYLKEVLRHRQVKLAVIAHFGSEAGPPTGHEGISHYLWNHVEDAHVFASEPLDVRASFYAFAVLGTPRRLLGNLRPNARMGLTGEQLAKMEERNETLGVLLRSEGFSDSQGGAAPHAPFVEYEPRPITVDPQSTFYCGPGSNQVFRETVPPPRPDLDLVEAILTLARERGTRVVFLDLPGLTTSTQHLDETIDIVTLPSDLYRQGLSRIGIPNAVLYKDLALDDIQRLYSDRRHYNRNGARYYTRIVTPALVTAHQETDRR